MTLSSTDDLCTGSTHDYNLNSDDSKIMKTPRKKKKFSGSGSPLSSPGEVDEDVQEEIEELCDNVPDIAQNFTVINKIGSGTFSSVYVAKLKQLPDIKQMFALKYLIPTSHPSRIENELKCLQQIGGHDHVMGVKACLRHRDHIVIVMPYFPHERFQDYVTTLSVSEVRDYMRALLVALRRVHSVDIIHRDVKPSNFLYNSKIKQYALVDFGLAQKAPATQKLSRTNEKSSNKSSPNHNSDIKSKPEKKKSCDKSSPNQNSDNKFKYDTESCRVTRKQSLESEQKQTSNKRKLSNDSRVEKSPKKKRLHSNESHDLRQNETRDKNRGKLAEIDINIPQPIKNSDTKQQQPDVIKQPIRTSDTSTVNNNNNKSKDSVIANVSQSQSSLMPKSLFNAKDQSLSKSLLKKRAIEMQQKTLEADGLQLAAPGVSVEKVHKKSCTVVVEKGGKQMYKSLAPSTCDCYGKPQICTICMARSSQHAPRAGTPGFRAPEVLLKYPDQTTAVDIWSAGVIFLSLMSGRYPFFKAPDDISALAQIISLFGTEKVNKAAHSMGKNLITNPELPGLNLKLVCEKLRGNRQTKPNTSVSSKSKNNSSVLESDGGWDCVPDSAYDLLGQLLDLEPETRVTAGEALKHPFFVDS